MRSVHYSGPLLWPDGSMTRDCDTACAVTAPRTHQDDRKSRRISEVTCRTCKQLIDICKPTSKAR